MCACQRNGPPGYVSPQNMNRRCMSALRCGAALRVPALQVVELHRAVGERTDDLVVDLARLGDAVLALVGTHRVTCLLADAAVGVAGIEALLGEQDLDLLYQRL